MSGTYHWVELPAEVKAIERRLAAPDVPPAERAALVDHRRALVASLRCEFGLSPLARLSTVQHMEALGMLVGPAEAPYQTLPWDDVETDRDAYLRVNDPPAQGGIGRWKFNTLGGGRVFPEEIEAALAAVPPEAHDAVARQVVWWPGFVAFLRTAQANGGFFT